jgi:hypothetical protein
VVGYVASHNYVAYDVTMDYLTTINDQRIEETGRGITLQEENELKEELFQSREFRKFVTNSAIKLSLFPFILVVFIMLFFLEKRYKEIEGQRGDSSTE